LNTPFAFNKTSRITPVMQQWHHLKKQHPDYILFFRMGDFYEFFYEDAKVMAKELDLKLTTRGTDEESKPIPLAGIPVKALDDYTKIAVEKKFPIAVAEQTSELQKFGSKEFFGREITQIITPGTVLNPDLLSDRSNNYLSAVYYSSKLSNENKNQFGFSFIDVTTGEFQISEYDTKEGLLNQIFRFSPSEIILSPESKEIGLEDDIKKIISNPLIFEAEKIDFDYEEAYKQITSFYKTHSLDGYGLKDYNAGISSAGAIISFLNNRNIYLTKKQPQTELNSDYLSIDLIARRNLELEQNQRDGTTKGTLLWVFDQTETSMGARKLRSWLRKPQRNVNLINERLDAVEFLFSNLLLREDPISILKKSPDIERIGTKLHSNYFNPKDALRLNEGLKTVQQVVEV
jgi:DNA mismatch repair protein MutS